MRNDKNFIKLTISIVLSISIISLIILGSYIKNNFGNDLTGNIVYSEPDYSNSKYPIDSSISNYKNIMTGNSIYSGYISPAQRIYINNRNITFENDSDIAYISFTLKDYIIFEKAYVSLDGKDWEEIVLTPIGESKNGWIKYGAKSTIAMSVESLRLQDSRNSTSENYIIFYSCSIYNSKWDCHDGWQIVDFSATLKKRSLQNNYTNSTNTTINYNTSQSSSSSSSSNDVAYTQNNNIVSTTNVSNNISNNNSNLSNNTVLNTTINQEVLSKCLKECNHIIYPNQTYIRMSQVGNVLPGDIVCIPAGYRKQLTIMNFAGTKSNPIIIKNCGGQVVMDGSYSTGHGVVINNASYFRFTGTGDSRYTYGIKLINSTSSGFGASSRSTDMEFDHLEIAGAGFAGFLLKTDPGCSLNTSRYNFIQYNTLVHDNYIHDTEGEGLYIGSSFYSSGHTVTCNNITTKILPHELHGVRIYNNLVRNAGWDCLQIASSPIDVEVYNNTLIGCGMLNASSQNMGMQIGGGTTGKFYNNYIENSRYGMQIQGAGDIYIYNNIILNSEVDGMLTSGSGNLNPNKGYIIENNLILNASRFGFYFLNNATNGTTFRNNIVIGPKYTFYKLHPVTLIISNNLNNTNIDYYKFKNPQVKDYHYTSSSPMIDAGLNTGLATRDFDGVVRPQGSIYDIGPFEFVGTPTNIITVVDFDSDGYNSNIDCNDNNANVNPSKTDVCGNGIDEDCSGADLSCATPTCTDGVMNGNELGVDCGGSCTACASLLTTGKKGTQLLFNHTILYNHTTGGITGYILYLPPNYNPANKYPTMIFLHGAGEKSCTSTLNYNLLRATGIPMLINYGSDLPFIIIMPQVGCTGDWNGNSLSQVVVVLDNVIKDYSVDTTRIYITGLSMGGAGTNKFVEGYYQIPAAAVPICGWGSVTCSTTQNIPRWVFSNEIDSTVASSGSKNVYNSLLKCTAEVDPRMSIYNASGHNSWSKTYDLTGMYDKMMPGSRDYDEEIYSWFMKYSRPELVSTTCFACIGDYDRDGYKINNDCNENDVTQWRRLPGYADSDNDGYTSSTLAYVCAGNNLPSGYLASKSTIIDCNNNNASISPGASEICGNNIDENCDGLKPACSTAVDSDSDGYNNTIDCNDNNANINPGKIEICGNSIDENCDGGDLACVVSSPTPTCSDGIQNGAETGVDCGGSCSACSTSIPAQNFLPSGNLFSYPFNTNAQDVSGNGYNGQVVGATWSVQSSSGKYTFDGNDYIVVSNGNTMDGLNSLTIESWVYNPELPPSYEYIIGKRKDTNTSWGIYIETATSNYVFFVNETTLGLKSPVKLNEWHHIVGTWDGSTLNFYTNGVLTTSKSFQITMNSFSTSNVVVGARETATGRTMHYIGTMGEIHVYNRALSASEIQSRYDSTKTKYQ